MPRARSLFVALVLVLIALWALTPIARAMLLLHDSQHAVPTPAVIAGVPTTSVSFYTSDPDNPIPIAGWWAMGSPAAPTVILVPGWKQDREMMIPYAEMLLKARLNVLLIDLRGTGHSGGSMSLGLHEPDDVAAAVSYLDSVSGLTNHHYGVLGVGFGAGVAIAAAGDPLHEIAGSPEIRAVIADSPWATENPVVTRLDSLHVFGAAIPLAPTANWAVTNVIGGSLDQHNALTGAAGLQKGQALLLIHSLKDDNPTATADDVSRLYTAAKATKAVVAPIWQAPLDGPDGVFAAQPAVYATQVLAFLHTYLVQIKDPPPVPTSPYPTSTPHYSH